MRRKNILFTTVITAMLCMGPVNALIITTTYSGNTSTMIYDPYYTTPGWLTRYTDTEYYPNTDAVTFTGTVDPSGLTSNSAIMIGLLDKVAVDDNYYFYDWAGGAYIYFGRIGQNLRVGPSDGFIGGEIVQVFKTYSGYFDGAMDPIEFEITIYDGDITVTLDGTPYTDTYGAIKTFNNGDNYANDEFEYGAYLGVDSFDSANDVDYELVFEIGEIPTDIDVEIDVKPGTYPNDINLKSKGRIPVAILTTDTFDAATVDPVTVEFMGADPLRWAWKDVDGDGDIDMILHFKTQELDITTSDMYGILLGDTFGGLTLGGYDTINVRD